MAHETRQLVAYAHQIGLADLPGAVRHEGVRSFVNWVGCVLGACRSPAVDRALLVREAFTGPREATIMGRGKQLDIFGAAFVHGIANSLYGYNDTHLRTVAHPSASVGAALLAMAERRGSSGADLLLALILGIELQCRIGNTIMTPPGHSHFGLSMVGLVGGLGAAIGVAKLMGLSERHTALALGIAGGQAGCTRENHGTMASHLLAGQTAAAGLLAALLAEQDFTASDATVEGQKGFTAVFGIDADPAIAVAGLGQDFEILSNAYKPYPCGIVIHPIIDACLDLVRAHNFTPEQIDRVELDVHLSAIQLTGSTHTPAEARRSFHQWAAIALIFRAAGMGQRTDAVAVDARVIALRQRVSGTADPTLASDAARATVYLKDGTRLHSTVDHARGAVDRPMTDDDLSEKFLGQAEMIMGATAAHEFLAQCWQIESIPNIETLMRHYFPVLPMG